MRKFCRYCGYKLNGEIEKCPSCGRVLTIPGKDGGGKSVVYMNYTTPIVEPGSDYNKNKVELLRDEKITSEMDELFTGTEMSDKSAYINKDADKAIGGEDGGQSDWFSAPGDL